MTSPRDKRIIAAGGSGYQYLDRKHRELGAFTCGYHAVIERSGVVINPRHPAVTGNHCPGINAVSYGICLVGGVDDQRVPTANYTDDQWTALHQVIASVLRQYPKAQVVGHHEVAARPTLCPSFDVPKWWYQFQSRKKPKESSDDHGPDNPSPNPPALP